MKRIVALCDTRLVIATALSLSVLLAPSAVGSANAASTVHKCQPWPRSNSDIPNASGRKQPTRPTRPFGYFAHKFGTATFDMMVHGSLGGSAMGAAMSAGLCASGLALVASPKT